MKLVTAIVAVIAVVFLTGSPAAANPTSLQLAASDPSLEIIVDSSGEVQLAQASKVIAEANALLTSVGADEVAESTQAMISIDLGSGADGGPSQSVLLIVLITLLAVAPSLLIMVTSFTRIIVVFGLLRNALGLQGVLPTQVLAGLGLFLTLFVMSPVISQVNDEALQPYLDGDLEQTEAFDAAAAPFKEFMLANTGAGELELMLKASGSSLAPETADDVGLAPLVAAFAISELKAAFIIGFIIAIPFLIIDLVTSASLMSLGMMMLPPPLVSAPIKLLLFVLANGWVLTTETLLAGFNGV